MITPPDDPTVEIGARSPLTSRRSVIALAGICLLLLGVVVWSIFGRAPQRVLGEGIILPAGGYTEVGTDITGLIDQVRVSPGDEVDRGEVVATVTQKDATTEEVTSPVDGLVVDVIARPGRITSPGVPLVTLEPADADLLTVAFLPAKSAESAEVGMRALVSPADSPRAQYGYIEGEVVAISPAPSNRERVMTLLGDNDELVDYFLEQGPVGEVTIAMTRADTPTGYAWTVGDGPDDRISAGTLADTAVILNDAAVIERIVQ